MILSSIASALRVVFFGKSQLALFEEIRPVKGSVDKHGNVKAPHFARRHVKRVEVKPVQLGLFGDAPKADKPKKKTLAEVAKEFGQAALFGDDGQATEAAAVKEPPKPAVDTLREKTLDGLRKLVADKGGKEAMGAVLIKAPKDRQDEMIAKFVAHGLTADEVRDELGITAAMEKQAAADNRREEVGARIRAAVKEHSEAVSAAKSRSYAAGDDITGVEFAHMPAGSIVELWHEGKPEGRKLMRGHEAIFMAKQRGKGWQKNPASKSGVSWMVDKKTTYRVLHVGQGDAWMHPAQKEMASKMLEITRKRHPNAVLASLNSNGALVIVNPDNPRQSIWIGEKPSSDGSNEWGAGFSDKDEKAVAAGEYEPVDLAKLSDDVPEPSALNADKFDPSMFDGLPEGATIIRGDGVRKSRFAVKLANGDLPASFEETPEKAVEEAKRVLSRRAESANAEEPAAVAEDGPKEGERNADGLVFRDGRWRRDDAEKSPTLVEHTTRKGKVIRGIVRKDLTQAEAKAIDEYTFKKDGGWFIREKYLGDVPAAPAVTQDFRVPVDTPATGKDSLPVQNLPGIDYSGDFDPSGIPAFGVKPGVSKLVRRQLNQAAADLVNSEREFPREFTDDEKALLRQYSGWGGCGQSLNEFYTPVPVAAAIWKVLANLGMKPGARVLEPSCGAGVFLHTAPAGVTVTGVEMDATSSKVAKALHGGRHEVVNASFERFATTDDRQFDAVVGNPPFGPRGESIAWDKADIGRAEQYFVDASLDKCADGGIVALVLPTGIMDNQNARWLRERILRKGQFMGAIRMPNTAFEASHTEVTTDVVFVRKHDNDVAQALGTVDKSVLKSLGQWDEDFLAGTYFTEGRGKENICGVLEDGWRAKAGIGNDITVNGSMAGVPETIAAFAPAMGEPVTLAAVLGKLDDDGKAKALNAAKSRPYQARLGDLKEIDGVTYVLQGQPPRWHRIDEVVDQGKLRTASDLAARIETLAQWRQNMQPVGDVVSEGFKRLPDDLRAYIAEHGNPAKDPDMHLAAKADRSLYRLIGAVKPDGTLSDLVEGRVAERIVGSFETAAISLAAEFGDFTPKDVATRWGKGDEAEVLEHLHASDAYCLNPDGSWTTADNYLSGSLWPKLDAVQAALAGGGLPEADRAKLEGQAGRLEKTINPAILDDVEIRLNDAWIPINVVEAWFNDRLAEEAKNNQYVAGLKAVEITFNKGVYKVTGGNQYQMDKFAMYLNRSGLRRDDRPMIDEWNEAFKSWLCGSEYRGQVEDLYNRKFKGFVAKEYSKEAFDIPGLSSDGLKDYQYAGLRWALNAGKGIIAADVGLGKAQPLDAKILTPTGWVLMGDIQVGDKVIAGDGSVTTVTGVFPQGEKEIFRVGFSDGSVTECCDEHLWLTQTALDRNNARRNCADKGVPKVRQLSEIRKTLRYLDREKNHSIPMVGAVQFDGAEIPIDGYLLGALIGDGGLSSGTPRFTNVDAGVIAEFLKVIPDGVNAVDTNASGAYTVRLSRESDARRADGAPGPNPLKEVLRELGLLVKSADKFIPDVYKFNSVAVRVAILQGLMDTDGYVDRLGVTVQFCSVSERLAKDVQFIVQSLGGNAAIKSRVTSFTHNGEKRTGQRSYLVHLRLPAWVEPFRGSVRKLRVRPKSKYSPVRYITSAESIGMKAAQCISVDHPSHLYVTDDFIVTHNTARGLMLARMMKVTGKANRPMIVVPKSVLANWAAEVDKWFPGAKVSVIGETYSKNPDGTLKGKVDGAAERNRKLHDLLQNEYDFILISRDAFNDIDLSPVEKGEQVDKDFWTQRGDSLGNKGDKQLNDIRTRHKQAAAGMDFRKRSDALWFDELGVDGLIIDEAHAYKNLWAAKARFGDTPKFLGGQGQSKRARDMFYKTQWLRGQTGGMNVYGLTATPTKNSPLEIYSMLSHVAPEAFEQIGIRNSEEFLDRFCKFATEFYIDPTSQSLTKGEVVAGFKNLDELRGIMSRYIDRTTAEMVGLKLPAKDERNVLVAMNADQQREYDRLRDMAEEASKQDAADGEAHIFSIMDKMAKAATDLELLDPEKYKGAKSPKLEKAADNIVAGIKQGGQVVFSDYLLTHQKLADMLVKRGIPREQIAIINAKEAEDSADRQNIADAFNSGKVKVVIGNTATMGEGINLQHGTTDIHHIDLPWEPASVQQRNGRGVRQGNKAESVRIHTYMVKGTFDSVRWNAVAAKKDWQEILWNGADEVDNLGKQKFSSDDMKIMLSADPEAARKQFDEDKAAAMERYTAGQREEAVGHFKKFREVQASFAALKDKGTKTANSLRMRLESYRTALKVNPHFRDKALLDSDVPAAISPVSGEAFYAGRAFEVPKDHAVSAGKYVVMGVDGDSVLVRQYGEKVSRSYSGSMLYTRIPVEKLSSIKTAAHSEDEEARYIAEKMERSVKEGNAAIKNPAEASHIGEESTRKLYDQLQEQIRESFVAYKDGWRGDYVPLIHPETGEVRAAQSYSARADIKDAGFHVMLPGLPEHREAAMKGFIENERGKFWTQRSIQKRRGGRTDWQKTVEYPGRFGNKSNAWGMAKDLWGEDFIREAKARYKVEQVERVKSAPTTAEAISEIAPLLVPDAMTYGDVTPKWEKQHVALLYAKAKANGDLDRQLSEVTGIGKFSDGKGNVPSWVVSSNSEYGTGVTLRQALMGHAGAFPDLKAVMLAEDERIEPSARVYALHGMSKKSAINADGTPYSYTWNGPKSHTAYEHDADAMAGIRHLVEKHPELAGRQVKEVIPLLHDHHDPVFGGEAQEMTMRDALKRG